MTDKVEIFDDTRCMLGEGPLWHPLRKQLFWVDILSQRVLTRTGDGPRSWTLDETPSALAWIDADRLLVATDRRLMTLDLGSGATGTVTALEADRPGTRSNDGRADPLGGFWIGTMGRKAEAGAGAIWRWHKGDLRCLFPGLSIPNSICFAPAGDRAYFADSRERKILTVALDAQGWPLAAPEVFVDLGGNGGAPDGSVCDAAGNLWNAQWGAARIAVYDPEGRLLATHPVPATHVTCPAFGGADFADLYCTSALEALAPDDPASANGQTLRLTGVGRGLAEPAVRL